MLHEPHDPELPLAVRDGRLTVVTCRSCGCRLQSDGNQAWRHFGALGGRDAQGHRTPCIDLPHDASGRTALSA